MKVNLFILIIFLLSACAVQNEFIVSEADKRPANAIGSYYYVLPQTVLKLKVDIEREIFIPGPYSRFTERYLGITEITEEGFEEFGISSVNITFLTEPDPDNYYSVNLLKGNFTAREYFELTTQGLILNPSGWIRQTSDAETNLASPEPPYFTDLSVTGLFSEVTDTLYKTIVTDTSFVRLPIPRRQREVKTMEQRAQEAANFILEIRRARFDIIAGEIDGFPSGNALEIAVRELDRLEKIYTELFVGKRYTDLHTRAFFITPDGSGQDIVLFKLLEENGIAEASSPKGIPLLLSIKPLDKLRNIQSVEVSASTAGNNLIYRMPDMALFRVVLGNQVYFEERATLHQAGKIVTMPVN